MAYIPQECYYCKSKSCAWDCDVDKWLCEDCHKKALNLLIGRCEICNVPILSWAELGIAWEDPNTNCFICNKEHCVKTKLEEINDDRTKT